MRHRRIIIGAALLLVCAVAAVFAAGALLPGGASSARAADSVVLTVLHNSTVVKTYTLAEVQSLATHTGCAGYMTSGGTVHGPDAVTGATLVTILQDAGFAMTTTQSLDVHAPDGYGQTLSYGQVVDGAPYEMFDAATQAAQNASEPLTPTLVYLRGGSALIPFDPVSREGDGPLRFYVTQPDNTHQVMEGSFSVSGVSTLNLRDQAVTEWNLRLVGLKIKGKRQVVTETRNAIEGCAQPNCHKSGWTDAGHQAWTGVPLWRLMGVVDGGPRHKDRSYNAALARKGYRIRLYNAAGKYVSISSKLTPYRNSIVLANEVAGAAPGSGYYPLRLVGPKKFVPASKRLGRITKIVMLPLK